MEASAEKTKKEMVLEFRRKFKSARKRIEKKIVKQELEFETAKKWILFQQIGDSLLANISQIKKGEQECVIKNVHSQDEELVKLNPKCSVTKNADLYYRKAKKGKRGLDTCGEQLQVSLNEQKEIESYIKKCTDCLGLDEDSDDFEKRFTTVYAAVGSCGLTVNSSTSKSKKKEKAKVPYRHITIDDWNIYLGKNNVQNDELSIKYAKPWDIWFHVVAHAGSHVVLKRDKNASWPPKDIIEKVAALSVWFSKAKHTSYAEVHVTEARFVRKRRKAPPGEVIAERCKTVRVSPISPQDMFRDKG